MERRLPINVLLWNTNMRTLLQFTKELPSDWAVCPIYFKGQEIEVERNGQKKTEIACGKRPIGYSHHRKVKPDDAALVIERSPERFGAIGVFTGPRSEGVVCLDIDANLSILRKEWEADLGGFHVLSPTPNAGKWFFSVSSEHWGEISDVSRAATGRGFEVLWGRQAILCGAYADGGEYEPHGDPNALPEAPGWLLALMRESHQLKHHQEEKRGIISSRYMTRSKEEKIVIARSCLSVVTPQGRGSEDQWWRIGAMLHSELPGEEGLELWREWSKRDDEYSEDWEGDRDPCAARWEGFKNKGSKGLGFGSLVNLADEFDPTRSRFQRDGLTQLVEEIEASPLRYRQDYLSGEELLRRSIELEETIEDPALLDQAKHMLAMEAGRREGAIAVDRLLDSHMTFKRSKGGKPADVSQLDDTGFEYLIPGILPKPWLLLVHADGGTGKSAMAMTICKHVSQGKPFNIHGSLVDVPRGKCLWLNGDQSERITKRQFNLIGVERGVDVVGEWDMQWYRRFCRMQEERKYDLVVIDSLDGCNDSNPYEENRREYALPLKRLARRNGVDFPACSIIVIHHNNRNGGFRGTSAIKAAVDETWNMRKLETKELAELGLTFNSRVITVEKSRDDREGQQMVFSLMPSYTYQISPMPECKTRLKGDGPNEFMLDVLQLLRQSGMPLSLPDIRDDSEIGGEHKERAIKYALQRLASQKLIERCDPPAGLKLKGRPPAYYRALGKDAPRFTKTPSHAQGESDLSMSKAKNPVTGTDLNDKADCLKSDFVESPEGGTPEPETLDKTGLSTKPIVVKNDCTGTEEGFSHDPHGHRVARDQAFDRWKQ